MTEQLTSRSYVALVHHPVYDKNHQIVATSITNLDIHDIARACKTYGVARYFLVHPVAAQRELARRIVSHWQATEGAEQNPLRSAALHLVSIASSIDEVIAAITDLEQAAPLVVATSARLHPGAVSVRDLRQECARSARPHLLLLGTGWGLLDECLERADRVLAPIRGRTDYNHLSVRTALGIMLDRLYADPEHNLGEQGR